MGGRGLSVEATPIASRLIPGPSPAYLDRKPSGHSLTKAAISMPTTPPSRSPSKSTSSTVTNTNQQHYAGQAQLSEITALQLNRAL